MFALGGAVLLLVFLALGLALSNAKVKHVVAGQRMIVLAGFALPVVVLSAALVYGLTTTAKLSAPSGAGEMRIRVSGEMWWWRVTYFDGNRAAFETANEIYIPAGRPVTLELTSADVIHSFWVPQLAAKLDMIPGRTNVLRVQADSPGVYRGQCTEFCGSHGANRTRRARSAARARPRCLYRRRLRDLSCGQWHGGQWRRRPQPYPHCKPAHIRRRHLAERRTDVAALDRECR
jgi:heme/copper-type cytochrome/quinol oxidase subunit 2